jgi:hydrogenase nickel incorporation protein HypA/HybF
VHELSVCHALLHQVTQIAQGRGASVVQSITVELGPLCGIEPMLLATAFGIMRAGSCAAQADLLIEETTVTVACAGCGAQSQTAPNRLTCAACGGFRTRIVAGDELRLRRVTLS